MRGPDIQQDSLFSTVSPESRVPKDHPLRPIRAMTDAAPCELDADFNALYASSGRDSIPPEKLLRAQLLMAFYTIRSERQLMEQIDYNLLFRWFVGFSMDDAVWDRSTFTKNRDRLLLLVIDRKKGAAMSMYEAVKHISKQDESSLTVIGMSDLLKEAKIPYTRMGYDSWGNFSYSQVLYVLEGKGYIAKRRNPSKGSTITITSTDDGRTTKVGKMLTANEMEVFRKLGLKSSKEESHNN